MACAVSAESSAPFGRDSFHQCFYGANRNIQLVELLLQRAAEDFRVIVESVEGLVGKVAASDWAAVRVLLPPLKRRLSEANGSFQKFLTSGSCGFLSGCFPRSRFR
jgi:hypothetical protein